MKKSTLIEILASCKNLTFEQATDYIKMKLSNRIECIRKMDCERLWRVNGVEGIGYISNSYKSLVTGMSDVRFIEN